MARASGNRVSAQIATVFSKLEEVGEIQGERYGTAVWRGDPFGERAVF